MAALPDQHEVMTEFIFQVELVLRIAETLTSIAGLGHFNYRGFQWVFTPVWIRGKREGSLILILQQNEEMTSQLEDLQDELQTDLTLWLEMLKEARGQYYFLTYLYPEQLYHLLNYLEDPELQPSIVLENSLMFINPKLALESLDTVEQEQIEITDDGLYEDLFGTLCSLGRFLDKVLYFTPSLKAVIAHTLL